MNIFDISNYCCRDFISYNIPVQNIKVNRGWICDGVKTQQLKRYKKEIQQLIVINQIINSLIITKQQNGITKYKPTMFLLTIFSTKT